MKKIKAPTYNQLLKPVTLPSGEKIPGLGIGTWYLGDNGSLHDIELSSLKLGLELGMNLIDTAEMYGNGKAEILTGEAVAGMREQVFLVSKFLPDNADRERLPLACEKSLKRLKTDYLDLYLLHWRGSHPLQDTVNTLNELVYAGKIRHWGVSNFDLPEMEELLSLDGGDQVSTNQVLYNLAHRNIEYALLPWCEKNHIPIMAYSPMDHGRIANPLLRKIALAHGVTSFQVALAWVLHRKNIIAIPKASSLSHMRANREALEIRLTQQDFIELDRAFPPPAHAEILEMY
ncbi:MAG: aldo/keto reductase [Bacteriovorax sp.]|nr:aldo/keto reductase [Bacteriovorax sp.]